MARSVVPMGRRMNGAEGFNLARAAKAIENTP